jgi:predicted permease
MPDFREYVRRQLPPLRVSGAREAEIVEEVALPLEEAYDRAIRNGATADEAWAEIERRVPSWADLGREIESVLHERIEPDRRPGLWDSLRRDLRFAVRQLRRSPAFTAIAVLTLALGIGANTAVFSLLDAVMLRSLPVGHPEQLLWFGSVRATGSTDFLPHRSTQVFSYNFFKEFHRRNQVFSNVAAIHSTVFGTHGRVAGNRELEKVAVELVSGSYFDTLGVRAAIGRTLSDADDRTPGTHPFAVASYAWWQRRFAADPAALGRVVTIGKTAYTIVGVAAPGFSGLTVGSSPDLWIPLAMEKEISPGWNGLDQNFFQSLHLIARPKPGIPVKQAQANTNLLFRQILMGFLGPQPTRDQTEDIQHAYVELLPATTGRSDLRSQFGSPLQILMVLVALVLLIACANIANLLLARATARQREIAVRMSMGAERWRLIRQLMVESGLLGIAGAALGIALAWQGSRALLAMVSGDDLLPVHVGPDPVMLAFAIALSLLTVVLFGAAPAFHATRLDLAHTLKQGRGIVSSRSRNRFSRGLVVGQVTLSLVLLAGAGLFLRTLTNLMKVDTGFDKNNVLLIGINPAAAGYDPDARLELMMQRLEESAGAIPGVVAASFVHNVFDGGGSSGDDVKVTGGTMPAKVPSCDDNVIGPRYFDVLKLPILLGRAFSVRDTEAAPKVAIVNETFARTFFPGQSPLGHTVTRGDEAEWHDVEIVGVVKDSKYMFVAEQQMPAIFYPHAQHHRQMLHEFVVRYTGNPAPLLPEIRKAIARTDPNLPATDVTTLAKQVDDSVRNRRIVAELSAAFGIVAALLACIGIYGVMSYGIARRTNEFGVRMALGGSRAMVLWVVLREALLLALAGVAIGLAVALACGRLVESVLFGLSSYDPLALGLAAAAMIAAALLAGLLPARRATRVDPSVALRYE